MDILKMIAGPVASISLPLFAVTLTALTRVNTPILLMLHWHGFRSEPAKIPIPGVSMRLPVPASALQLNENWNTLLCLDEAMLDAAWRLGAWELDREERRACNIVGTPERETLACRQAFGDYPLQADSEAWLVADTPDRLDMMRLGASAGYILWQFRPVGYGLWRESAEDATLAADGFRPPPCPVTPRESVGSRFSRTCYRLGRNERIIVL